MTRRDLAVLLARGEELFTSLEEHTTACLNRLETMQIDEVEEFVRKRRDVLASLEAFAIELGESVENDSSVLVAGFRKRQASLLQRVIEADGLIAGIASQEMASLQTQLAEIARGRSALHSYRDDAATARLSMNRTA